MVLSLGKLFWFARSYKLFLFDRLPKAISPLDNPPLNAYHSRKLMGETSMNDFDDPNNIRLLKLAQKITLSHSLKPISEKDMAIIKTIGELTKKAQKNFCIGKSKIDRIGAFAKVPFKAGSNVPVFVIWGGRLRRVRFRGKLRGFMGFNHSCDNFNLKGNVWDSYLVRAYKDIKVGDELTIHASYSDLTCKCKTHDQLY